ncbi:hypothetical protein ABQD61_12765 [Enterococcus asini]|uniref:hypothetical protein n=1 Tax=Enterococcus asini TaxID=57732 RepID=UPI0032E4AD7E
MKTVGNSYYLTANTADLGSCKKMIKEFFLGEGHSLVVDTGAGFSNDTLWYPFLFTESEREYQGRFSFYRGNTSSENSDGVFFDVEVMYENNKMNAVLALSKKLTCLSMDKGEEFYLTSLNDGVSEYFREISYKHAAKYEKKLRELLLVTFVPKSGKYWVEQLTHLTSSLKPNQKNMIEKGLEELDLFQLEEIFFGKVNTFSEDEYEKLFDLNNLDTYSAMSLRIMIRENRPKSIWEEYIEQYISITDIAGRMKTIRNQRNKVAHVKYFSGENYLKFRRDAGYVTRKVDEAIKEIKSESNKIDTSNMISSITGIIKTFQESVIAMNQVQLSGLSALKDSFSGITDVATAITSGVRNIKKGLE